MSFVCPAHLMVDATRAVALSALPDAPVEPDDPPKARRSRRLLALLFRTHRRRSLIKPAPATTDDLDDFPRITVPDDVDPVEVLLSMRADER